MKSMADCYALNVCSDRDVWLYFYRIPSPPARQYYWWPLGDVGPRVARLAVDRSRVLLAGRYERILFLGRLDTLVFQEFTPVDEQEQPLRTFRAFGRRHKLYLQTEEAL